MYRFMCSPTSRDLLKSN